MRYRELPQEYKELVKLRSEFSEKYLESSNSHVVDLFDWESTPETYEFWDEVNSADNISELPKIPFIKESLESRIAKVFSSGPSIKIENVAKRIEEMWEIRIVWAHVQRPGDKEIKSCKWEGFEDIDACVDDCLEYIETLKQK